MNVSNLMKGLIAAVSVFTFSTFSFKASAGHDTSEVTNNIEIEFAALPEVLNAYSTIGQLTADLARIGLATIEERSAIENFLVDRGVKFESPLEEVIYDAATSTFRFSEISLTVLPDGHLKNSFGQILKIGGKTLDSTFGEAYLSFDRKTARARAMDIFLQEAHAASTGASPQMRASGALIAGILGKAKDMSHSGLDHLAAAKTALLNVPWSSIFKPNNTVLCGPNGEFLYRKSSSVTTPVDPNLLQLFYQWKVPKCSQPSLAQVRVLVRAKGTTPQEKIQNANLGKGYDISNDHGRSEFSAPGPARPSRSKASR